MSYQFETSLKTLSCNNSFEMRTQTLFKARGVHEHEPALPMGCAEANQSLMGKVHMVRFLNLLYEK